MKQDVTSIERAFELAGTGAFDHVEAIRRQLRREGYDAHLIQGRGLAKQLAAALKQAKSGLSH